MARAVIDHSKQGLPGSQRQEPSAYCWQHCREYAQGHERREKMNMNVSSAKDISDVLSNARIRSRHCVYAGRRIAGGRSGQGKETGRLCDRHPRNPTNSMVVQCVGVIRISKKSWMTRSSRFSSRAKSTPSTINGLISPSLPKA